MCFFPTVPNKPDNFSSMTGSSESINLSWKRPNGYLESYELFYTNGSGELKEIINFNGEDVTHSLSGLSSDSSYTVNLRTLSFGHNSGNETESSWTRE